MNSGLVGLEAAEQRIEAAGQAAKVAAAVEHRLQNQFGAGAVPRIQTVAFETPSPAAEPATWVPWPSGSYLRPGRPSA